MIHQDRYAKFLRKLGFDAVTHGFRPGFRDWAPEETQTPHAVMKSALSPEHLNLVSRATNEATLVTTHRRRREAAEN